MLSVVQSYKHVGVRTAASGTIMEEICTRTAVVATEARPLRQKLFKKPGISDAAKKCALELLLLNRKNYHVECWPGLMQQEYHSFKSSTIRLYKLLLPVPLVVDGYGDGDEQESAAISPVGHSSWLAQLRSQILELHPMGPKKKTKDSILSELKGASTRGAA